MATFKYTTLNNIAQDGIDRLGENFVKTDDVNEAQGILVRSAKMHNMEISDQLLAVGRAGAGVNNIPIDKMAEKGIVVFNSPGANSNAVKELVIAVLILASRNIVDGINWVQANENNPDIAADVEKEKKKFAGTEIKGKKLGVIGLGAIGAKVSKAAVSLGMDVYGYDPFVDAKKAKDINKKMTFISSVDDIYENCDYITIHVPAMESTKDYINEESIRKMKEGVVVLNMARDVLIDEEAMLVALDEGKVRYYVSDFPNPTVTGHKNCITIPHLGASTEEAEKNCAIMACDELREYLEYGNIKNSVNYPNIDAGVCASECRLLVLHKNIPGMIKKLAHVVEDEGINVAEMTNRSKGSYAVTVLDLDSQISGQNIESLSKIDGVFKIRKVK